MGDSFCSKKLLRNETKKGDSISHISNNNKDANGVSQDLIAKSGNHSPLKGKELAILNDISIVGDPKDCNVVLEVDWDGNT